MKDRREKVYKVTPLLLINLPADSLLSNADRKDRLSHFYLGEEGENANVYLLRGIKVAKSGGKGPRLDGAWHAASP